MSHIAIIQSMNRFIFFDRFEKIGRRDLAGQKIPVRKAQPLWEPQCCLNNMAKNN